MTSKKFEPPPFRGVITGSIMLSTLLYSIDWTIVVVAFPHMRGIFSATEDQVAWIITAYIVASAIAMPCSSWASERFGRKTVMLWALFGFTTASIFCGAADTLIVEVISRVFQGLSGAFILPLSNAIILDNYAPEEHGKALSIWSVGAFSGSMLGPVLGGFLTEYISWRYIFYINIPIGTLAFLGVLFFMPETKRSRERSFDWLGFFLLATCVGSLQIMMDRGQRLDWFESGEIVVEGVIALGAFYLFVTHVFTSSNPFLNPRLLLIRQFRLGLILMAFYGIITVPLLAMLPIFLEGIRGYSIDIVGLLQLPRGVGLVVALVIAGWLSGRVDPRVPMGVGLVMITGSYFAMAFWNADVSVEAILWTALFQGIGNGIIIVPFQEVAFYGLAANIRTEASSVLQLIRSVSSSIGVSVALIVYFVNSGRSRSDLVENVNAFQALPDHPAGFLTNLGLAFWEQEIDRQASMLGYHAVFVFLGCLALLPLIALFFVGQLHTGDQSSNRS